MGQQQGNFEDWLLEDQLRHLDEHLSQDTFTDLLGLCAAAMDSAPLLHLVTQAQSRLLDLTPLGPLLLELRPSTLQSLADLEGLSAPAATAWAVAEPEHLLHFCLLDRYLRRQTPELWQEQMEGVSQQLEACLVEGAAPRPDLLIRLEGEEQKRLRASYPEAWKKWDEAWRETARTAIQLLAERPRGVSQANAERLLAQQVYTDPGHFLLELLQNADDAGATEFSVDFQEEQLTVTHNGAPFDFRDLVGILSIGQTTKKITQIGFFGVGFKSIYEVTDRPRLRSGYLNFEIADISIPRPLTSSGYSEATELVLPLKAGLDWRPFWEKAQAIEPALLLNVPNLRCLRWSNQLGGTLELSVKSLEDDRFALRQGAREQIFRVWKSRYKHRGERPPGKPNSAHLHLALPEQELSPFAPTLYSFLPITEPSGLRFIAGSHFDVPVDRERLDVASCWNQGIIARIAQVLSERLLRQPHLGWELLPLFPLPQDPLGPLFKELPETLAQALRELPIVEGHDASTIRGCEAWILDQDLAPLFPQSKDPLLVTDERRREWLTMLGAQTYDLGTLLSDLGRGQRPGLLQSNDAEPWTHLHHLLGREPDTPDWRSTVREKPILLDQDLSPVAPSQVLLIGDQWLSLFRDPPRTVHQSLKNPTTAALLAQLDVQLFGWEHLVGYLKDHGPDNLKAEALFTHLLQAPRPLALACLESPLCKDQQGNPGRLVPLSICQLGIVAAHPSVPSSLFPDLRFLDPSPALSELLAALNWPFFELGHALRLLASEHRILEDGQCEELVALLLETDYAWTAEAIDDLVALPVFESASGSRLPLELMWLYRDQELAALLPGLPELSRDTNSAALVERLGLSHHLNKADLDTLLANMEETELESALGYLTSQANSLTHYQAVNLLSQPLFDGHSVAFNPEEADASCRLVAEPDLASLLGGLGLPVLGEARSRQLEPLLQAANYRLLGLPQLVERLSQAPPPVELLEELQSVLVRRATDLTLAYSEDFRQELPVWLNRQGKVVAALSLPPSEELAVQMGLDQNRPSEDNPEEFLELFPLGDVEEYVAKALVSEAHIGQPLSAQPTWCGSVESVDRLAVHLKHGTLCVDALERLRVENLMLAPALAYPFLRRSRLNQELLHPESSQDQQDHCTRLAPSLVLQAYLELESTLQERLDLYAYLEEDLAAVAADSGARELLVSEPIWPTEGGARKALSDLILDPDFPDLGQDWHPHAEVPASLLKRLESTLGVGRPEPLSMLSKHLLPAYSKSRSKRLRIQILDCMSRLSEDLDQATLRRTLRPPNGSGPFPLPNGVPIEGDYHPPNDVKALPSVPAAQSASLRLLRRLGLPYLPSAKALQAVSLTQEDGRALLDLVLWAWQQEREALEPLWGVLGELRWMPSRDEALRSPKQLFIRGAEVEDLIGDSPSLFSSRSLPVGLARRLGLKESDQVDASLVLDHFQSLIRAGVRAPVRIYAFLEDCLEEGRISGAYLLERLRELPWVWTDDGEYRRANHVLGATAFRYFGKYRGTWEGAHQRFPGLARLFSIPESVNSEAVLAFLEEVREMPYSVDLRRLLGSCLSFLGEHGVELERDWEVLPARELPSQEDVLVSAKDLGVVRSNSPTLAALFAEKGRLYIVDPGDRESCFDLERLYDQLKIPHLRDAYTVKPDRSGRDVSEELGEAVAQFRQLLRSLQAVLPRLRAARPEWQEGDWLAGRRLAKLTGSGSIRVIEDLRLHYIFPQVAEVEVEAAAAFDPERKELLVSSQALTQPTRYAVSLAEGLLECLYQGPGSEGLVDLLNLLIPLGDQANMDHYLDQRHFPRSFENEEPRSALEDRLGELLDYGFHRRLERQYPELQGAQWHAWREADLEGMEPPQAARHLLAELGLSDPAQDLVESLQEMLSTRRLELMVSNEMPAVPRAEPQGPEPTPSPTTTVSVVAPQNPVKQRATGLSRVKQTVLGKLGKWFGGTATPAEGKPVIGLNSQLYDVAESYRNPPERHLVVSTRALTGPDLYCISTLGVDFDANHQIYQPAQMPWPDAFIPSGRTVTFSGRLTHPDHTMPKPMYSRLTRPPSVRGSKGTLRGPNRYGDYRLKTESPEAQLGYSVELSAHPDYQVSARLHDIDPRLLRPTTPNSALPALVHEWIEWARLSGLTPWELTERAREFVVSHYFYDLRFLERPEVQAAVERPLAPAENRFLSLLHAGPFGPYLGRGVCLEISAVLLEILRRIGVPSMLAQVWMLDEGLIHQPDHAIVLALLQSARGPYWYPLDASQNRTVSHQPEEEVTLSRADLLQRAADLVVGPGLTLTGDQGQRESALEAALLEHLLEHKILETLLECMSKSGNYLRSLSPELEWLIQRGYLRAEQESLYKVWPASSSVTEH